MLRTIGVAFLLFLPVSALVGYATNPSTIVFTDLVRREVGVMRVCPSPDLKHDTERAAAEWNTAIAFFSARFGWFELLGMRFEVVETGCDAYVVPGKLPERFNAMTLPAEDDGNKVVHVVVVSDTLAPERRSSVVAHEFIHILGLREGFSPKAPFRPVTDTSGLGRVTSHDVYALYVKVRGADSTAVSVPPYIPYMTADMPLPDIASAAVSVLAALTLDRMFRRRRKV